MRFLSGFLSKNRARKTATRIVSRALEPVRKMLQDLAAPSKQKRRRHIDLMFQRFPRLEPRKPGRLPFSLLDLGLISTVAALVALVAKANLVAGTWFLGWDSIMSELNLKLNLARGLAGVWQEFQGVGLVGGHGYVTDLVHVVFLWLLSLAAPTHLIRYFYTFLTWFIGGLGCFFFVKRIFIRINVEKAAASLLAFLAAIVYEFHAYSIQNFYVQLDSFVWYFAFLPWSLVLLFGLLEKFSLRKLAAFLIFQFIFSYAGFVPPVFIGYLSLVGMVLATYLLILRSRQALKHTILITLTIFVAHAYWLLPLGYFTLTQRDVYLNSKLNQETTIQNNLKSQYYGGLGKVLTGEGFYFDSLDVSEAGEETVPILAPWAEHLERPLVTGLSVTVFAIAVFGLIKSLKITTRSIYVSIPIGLILLFSTIAVDIFPFSLLSRSLRLIPVFNQAFRISFTKFSVSYVLLFAVAVAFGVYGLILELVRRGRKPWLAWLVTLGLVLVAVAFIAAPAFQGKFLYARSRVNLPEEYLEVIDFFAGQREDARIALFPVHTFNGWTISNWGYTGSGFLHYGIKQPLLDRAFDVWSEPNASFYNQVSTAVYAQDQEALAKTLDKYDVSFVLLDESVSAPGQEAEILRIAASKKLLTDIGAQLAWEKGALSVFDLRQFLGEQNAISSPKKVTLASAEAGKARRDIAYNQLGNRASIKDKPDAGLAGEIVYPFADLTQEKIDGISYTGEQPELTKIKISRAVSASDTRHELLIPALSPDSFYETSASITYQGTRLLVSFKQPLTVSLDAKIQELASLPALVLETDRPYQKILVGIGSQVIDLEPGSEKQVSAISLKVGEPIEVAVFDQVRSEQILVKDQFANSKVTKCWEREAGEGLIESEKVGDVLVIKTRDASGCISLKLGDIVHENELLRVSLPYRSHQGARPNFCVVAQGEDFECQHEEVFYRTPTSDTWTRVERLIIPQSPKVYWMDISARPPDSKSESWIIEYQAPEVVRFPLLARVRFSKDIWNAVSAQKRIEVGKDADSINVEFTRAGQAVDLVRGGRAKPRNCDLFERGWVDKSSAAGSVTYRAGAQGAACDLTVLETISNQTSFIMEIQGEGVSGRGARFHLFNRASDRNDLEFLLPQGTYETSYAILSWPNLEERGYSFVVETRSFGREISENRLNKITLYQVPLEWLAAWRMEPVTGFKQARDESQLDTKVEVKNTSKIGTGFYEVNLESKTNQGLLLLSQGYDKGWQAYKINSKFPFDYAQGEPFDKAQGKPFDKAQGEPFDKAQDKQIPNSKLSQLTTMLLAPILGEKLTHVKVNGWANGWLVPSGEQTIVLAFLPQYLEFAGFALAIASLIILATGKEKKKPGFLQRLLGKSYTGFVRAAQTLEKVKNSLQAVAKQLWPVELKLHKTKKE